MMDGKYKFRWLAGPIIIVLGYILAAISVENRVLVQVSSQLEPLVERSLSSYLFGVKGRSSRDDQAIEGLIKQVNMILEDLSPDSLWSPVYVGRISLESIGDLEAMAREETDANLNHVRGFTFNLERDGKPREISVAVSFSPNGRWIAFWAIFVVILMLGLARIFPVPLRGFQEDVYLGMKNHGVADMDAITVSRAAKPETRFSDLQWNVFKNVIKRSKQDTVQLTRALEILQRTEDPVLSGQNRRWLDYGLSTGLDLEQAIQLAAEEDSIKYDVEQEQLLLRGLPVKMQKGPLLYYLWYLKYRQEGDGWISNPRAKKKDEAYGRELENLADQLFGGKIDDRTLEGLSNGVSAKTLNDMRSKIKKTILAALPDAPVEEVYLVDDSRPSTVNAGGNDFRVRLASGAEMVAL